MWTIEPTSLLPNFPVISSVGMAKDTHALNVNADVLATNIAIAFKAEKLIFLTLQ